MQHQYGREPKPETEAGVQHVKYESCSGAQHQKSRNSSLKVTISLVHGGAHLSSDNGTTCYMIVFPPKSAARPVTSQTGRNDELQPRLFLDVLGWTVCR